MNERDRRVGGCGGREGGWRGSKEGSEGEVERGTEGGREGGRDTKDFCEFFRILFLVCQWHFNGIIRQRPTKSQRQLHL